MSATTEAPMRESDLRRRRSHPIHRRPPVRPGAFRPGGPAVAPVAGTGLHRDRAARVRCDDPRLVARAAAVRRRHLLLAALAVGLLLLLASPWSGQARPGLATPGPTPVGSALVAHTVYVVQPGDTLWSIAERLDPGADPRPVITELGDQIGSATVRAGQRLLLP